MRSLAFSVVIPAYNHEAFIAEAVASVRAQTHEHWTLCVVDDGSTDGTRKAAQVAAQGDPRVHFMSQANGGSHAAINAGLAQATGDWVAVLNSDDRWAPTRLQRACEEATSGATFITTGVRLIDGQGEPLNDPGHWWHQAQRDFRARVAQWGPLEGLMHGNYTVSTSNVMVQRELLQRVGGVKPLRLVPDWDWALRLALAQPEGLRFLADEPLLDYRLHGGNAILNQRLRGDLEINHLHRGLLRDLGLPQAAVNAVFRNQRDLRRNWRRLGEERVEAFLRDREADVASLQAELSRALGFVRDREADVVLLQQQTAALRLRLATLKAESDLLLEQLRIIHQSRVWRLREWLRRQLRLGA